MLPISFLRHRVHIFPASRLGESRNKRQESNRKWLWVHTGKFMRAGSAGKGIVASWRSLCRVFRPDIDDGANEERKRGGTGWRMESADLQSGRYLQVKSSHCRERLRTPHRLDNPADRRDSFHSAIAPWHGCLSRSNFASVDKKADRALENAFRTPRVRDYAIFFRRLSPDFPLMSS